MSAEYAFQVIRVVVNVTACVVVPVCAVYLAYRFGDKK